VAKNRARSVVSYDLEFAFSGLVPTSERSDGEGTKDASSKTLAEFRSRFGDAIEEQIRAIPREDRKAYPLTRGETVMVTIIQFTGSERVFRDGNDVDNFAKSILDPLQGRVFEDDSQVQSLSANKLYIDGYENIVYVGIKRVSKKATYNELVKHAGAQHARDVCDDVLKAEAMR